MTDVAMTCGMWRGITTPAGWLPPVSDAMPGMFAKLATKEGKEASKYANACAMALELSADGMVRDGKALKEADLFIALAEADKEAKEAAAALRAAAEQAKMEANARAQRVTNLVVTIKEAQVKGGITYEMMLTWANIARESGAYLTMHGGTDNGAGIDVRFTQAAQVKEAGAPRAPRETGGGSKGGAETRTSAYAAALQAQKVAGCPHNVTRTGNKEDGYTYSDHGKVIVGPLTKYLHGTYPKQGGAAILDEYDARRAAASRGA